jgi:DNA-binding beta-propeller fold protein YncE
MRLLLPLALLVFGGLATSAAIGAGVSSSDSGRDAKTAWVAHYGFADGVNGSSVALAASPDGSKLYVLEGSDDSAMLGGARIADYVTVAYDAATGARLWAAPYRPSKGANRAYGLAVGSDGSRVFVTGDNSIGEAATVAYNSANGAQLWVAAAPGVHSDAIAVSGNGTNVYVLAYGSKASGSPLVVLAYAARSGVKAWAARYRASKDEGVFPEALTVSPSGNRVYIAATGSNNVASWDVTVAYDAATGGRIWSAVSKRGNGPTAGIVVSPGGSSVYVAGGGYGADAQGVVVAYEAASGSQRWLAHYHDPDNHAGGDTAEAIAVSANGKHLYVGGQTGSGSADITEAYSTSTGARLWLARDRNGIDVNAIAASRDGTKVFVAGTKLPDNRFGLTLAYDAATGRQLWLNRYTGSAQGNALLNSMAVSPDGRMVYVTGADRSSGPHKRYACVTIAYRVG